MVGFSADYVVDRMDHQNIVKVTFKCGAEERLLRAFLCTTEFDGDFV